MFLTNVMAVAIAYSWTRTFTRNLNRHVNSHNIVLTKSKTKTKFHYFPCCEVLKISPHLGPFLQNNATKAQPLKCLKLVQMSNQEQKWVCPVFVSCWHCLTIVSHFFEQRMFLMQVVASGRNLMMNHHIKCSFSSICIGWKRLFGCYLLLLKDKKAKKLSMLNQILFRRPVAHTWWRKLVIVLNNVVYRYYEHRPITAVRNQARCSYMKHWSIWVML